MDDFSSRQRVARPESAASSRTQTSRMTPTSSNNSSANLPFRGASGASLLQERLRERKVRRGSIDLSDRGVQSSPVRASHGKDERRPSSSGKGMGVKQMEDQVSTLHKQNFDLKLELFHRRQRQEKLEEMLATAEKRIEEQAELQEVNEELLEELEKRDQALDEAVGLIVTLEDKIARLMDERAGVRAYDEQTYQDNHESESSSPPRPAPNKLPRMPSFLSDHSEGTEALRSLYVPHEGSLPKLSEEGMDAMDSPRLSVLSESSFVSIYGEKKLPELSLDDPDISQRQRASSNTEKWVDERPVPTRTPLRPAGKSQYLSLNDIIASPLQRLEKLQAKMESLPNINTHKSSFEDRQALPPTPDTFSTSTLQTKRNFTSSTETLHKNAMTSFPNQSTISIRPRSAGETITSRREGHGWDTPTETNTDAGSVISAISNSYRPTGIVPPNLFSFAPGDWGKDVMFSHDPAPPVPSHRRLRRLSVGEEPKSDNSFRGSGTRYGDLSQYGTSPIDTTPKPALPDRRSSLNAPMKSRRSHQSSSNSSNSPSSTQATPGGSNASSSPAKRSRISSSFGIFRRNEASPLSNVQSSPVAAPRPSQATRSYTYTDSNPEEDSRISATPPPIRRNRATNSSYRPSSAGNGASRERSMGFDGADSAITGISRDVVSEKREARRERKESVNIATKEVDEKEEAGKGRIGKWLGLGGNGLRRN